jgi:chemotaxis protein MotA
MFVIVGSIIVVVAVLGGFTMAGGKIGALLHLSEWVIIVGSALGALIVSAPKKVLVDMLKGLVGTLKGTPYNGAAYQEMFKCLYDMMRLARRDGMLALEPHIANPHESSIFNRYPSIAKNHHVTKFICGGVAPLVEATANAEQLSELLDAEIRIMEE